MTDVGTASKKGAQGKVVEDMRRLILLAFWVVERATFSYGKPGHALPLTYNHATYGGPVLVLAGLPSATEKSKVVTLGLPSVQTVYTLLQHD